MIMLDVYIYIYDSLSRAYGDTLYRDYIAIMRLGFRGIHYVGIT